MKIIIYGSSDDCVEVEGCEGADEFNCDQWQGDLAPPGEGEKMRVHCWYDEDGCWQVGAGQIDEDRQMPPWPVTITQGPVGYSAKLTIDAPEGTRLVNVRAGS